MSEEVSVDVDANRHARRVGRVEEARLSYGWRGALVGVAALYIVVLVAGLGQFPFLGPDEPRYAEVAREMFASGDYVSPRLCGLLWFEKPALFYWMAAASYHVFGVNEFAARLPSAVAAVGTALFCGWSLWRLGLGRLGALAALVLLTSAIWVAFSHAATTDMLLAATVAVSLLAAFASTETQGRERLAFLLLCVASAGLSMIAKGLIGSLLVIGTLIIHSVFTRRSLFRNFKEAIVAGLLFVVVASAWYGPVMLQHGRVFVDEFFLNHHFKRYLTNKYQHPQPPYFYLFVVMVGSVPWAFFLLPALARLRGLRPEADGEGRRQNSLLALAWAWLLVTVGFFSFSTSKLPGYILPAFPALALVLGAEVERLWSGDRTRLLKMAARLNAVCLLMLWVGGGLYLHHKHLVNTGVSLTLALALCALSILAVGALLWSGAGVGRLNWARVATLAPAAAMTVALVTSTLILPTVGSRIGSRDYAVQVSSQLKPQEDILFYRHKKQYAHVFYSNGRVVFYHHGHIVTGMSSGDDLGVESRHELLLALRQEKMEGERSAVVLTSKEWQPELMSEPRLSAQLIAQQDDLMAFRVQLQPSAG